MVKSSEVLRFAAENLFVCPENWHPLGSASGELGENAKSFSKTFKYAEIAGYGQLVSIENEVLALCFAAAIAESQGD